ncbi:MAG: hypothetical protein ACE5OR_11675 [bacterium]
MAHTFEELKKKTVNELREIAATIDHEAVKGYTQLNKEHLLAALCEALGIDMHEHHKVVGIEKAAIKAKIRSLKRTRDEALSAHDHAQLKAVRRKIHGLKRALRRATV